LKLSAAPFFAPVDVRTLPAPGPNGRTGRRRQAAGAAEEHARHVAAAVDAAVIREAGLSVEISGGGEAEAEALLAELGCRPDASADLRLELDADGDRLSAGDPEWTLPLAALAR